MANTDYDEELRLAIEDLISKGELEAGTAAHGVALQVIEDGYDSLTVTERYVYVTVVLPLLEAKARRLEANWQSKID